MPPKKTSRAAKSQHAHKLKSTDSLNQALRGIVTQLNIAQAAVICAAEVLKEQAADYDPEVALLLQRCASDRMHDQIEALEQLISRRI